MYLLIKYIKRVLWRVAKLLPYMQDARCLKVNVKNYDLDIDVHSIKCSHLAGFAHLIVSEISLNWNA